MGTQYEVFPEPSGCPSFWAEVSEHNRFYELRLEFDIYRRPTQARAAWATSGRTIRWQRDNVLVAMERAVAPGSAVELAVRWTPGVQLVLQGQVIGEDPGGTLIKIRRPRFRGKPQSFRAPAGRGSKWRPHQTARGVTAAVALLATAASGGLLCN